MYCVSCVPCRALRAGKCGRYGQRAQRTRAYAEWLGPMEHMRQHLWALAQHESQWAPRLIVNIIIYRLLHARSHTHTAHTSPVTGLLSCASLNLKSFRKHTRNVRYLSWNIRQVGTYVRGTTAARASYRARVCVRSTWPKNVSRTITFFGACWMAYLRSLRVFEHNAPLPTCACHTMRCETEWAAPSKMIDIFRLSSEFLDLFALV